ncbi:MAG: hypothetical protein HY243_05220 [Proteobacteria bacterium]|nr:hypothetical protein [Pseudomonadota bacterium]
MISNRITDPQRVTARDIQLVLDQGSAPIVQFSTPGYSPELLRGLNQLCIEFGTDLELRFYGHYGDKFDAAALTYLPDVRSLSVDCLQQIANEDSLSRLSRLERLSFGVYRFNKSNFLQSLPLQHIRELSLSETELRNFDLAPLKNGARLTNLFIQGHTKNIDALAALPGLKVLSLSSMPARQELSLIKRIVKLQSLTLILGGRSTIHELSHDQLQSLEIIRVRGLESLGDLHRFPRLAQLHVEDQLQLRTIDLFGVQLRELFVHNCKNLNQITNLEKQSHLAHLRISRTKLDLDKLLANNWPEPMTVLALYSGSTTWNKKTRAILDQRGYREFAINPRLD